MRNENKLRLCFGEWSVTNPYYEPLHEALHCARYQLDMLTQSQAYLICSAAEDYLHFVAHPATTKSIVAQLRKVRAAVKQNRNG